MTRRRVRLEERGLMCGRILVGYDVVFLWRSGIAKSYTLVR